MGCKNSKTVPTENVDYRNVPDVNENYPPPYVPDSTRAELYDDDVNTDIQKKIDAMPKGTDGSYKTLLEYLSSGATKETQHVTAIYLWMKAQDYNSAALDLVKEGDTPRGYMKMIKEQRGDFTTFFTIMCRRSGIPCNMITGLGKDGSYYIGMPENSMQTKWNAVYTDEEWHLAHIEWAMQNRDSPDGAEDQNFYFLTDPDDFSTICYPTDFNWQLLDQPMSKKQFLNLPYFGPHFFMMNTSILSPKSGIAKAANGKLDVEIGFPKRHMENIDVSSVTTFIGRLNEVNNTETSLNNLDKYVFVNRKASKFIFEVTFPTAGRYLFDVYGDYGDKQVKKDKKSSKKPGKGLHRLCQFRIISEKEFEDGDIEPLPDSPENGWGPGPRCRRLGLVPLTHFESCIYMKPGEIRDVYFRMDNDLDVTCQLTHNFLPVYELVEQIECTKGDSEVQIRVRIPEMGLYALKIYCREAGSKVFDEACVYLIRQREKARLPEKHRDKMLRNRLEYHIKNHTTEAALIDALDVYKCYNVPDHGEFVQGQDKLKQYWEIKRELRSAIKGRNVNVVKKWIARAKRSTYQQDLQDDINEAERLQDNLNKMKGHRHPMAKMDPQTIIEIRNYKRPPKIVHDVMSSTYLLLGERKEYVQDWEDIQYLLGKHGSDNIQKRVVTRRPEDIDIEIADDADSLIQPYSIDKCRDVSNGICSFYKWNKHMIKEVRQKDQSERERMEEEMQQLEDDVELHDAKDESTLSDDKKGEHVVYKGRGDVNDLEKDVNDVKDDPGNVKSEATDEHGESEIKNRHFMSPSKPPETKQVSPVAYAGWKPADIQ
ncbi:lim and transglutaminase domain protein ltd-1-like [Ruditapes philippinarum]|uniref:lim and transglutaminase domain protein ltd-1-like n=1 Tax=Ruditapes philippinarum TaxID=129788 RepID=UPI00295B643E|nr:lim and transglutaminase domain protein ltd-1-like [Ruditapes philippinarum]